MNDKIVVGIPGHWTSREDLVTSIAKRSGGHLFAGNVLMNVETSEACQVDVYEHDPHLRRAFEIAGGKRFPPGLLDDIARHTFTMYLISPELSRAGVTGMRAFAAAVLRSGGLAVKVESSGIAHTANEWLEKSDSDAVSFLYRLFTTYVASDRDYYSCGMKNFGLPDASITRTIPASDAAQTMHVFNMYQLTEQPVFKDGHTFSTGPDAPHYRLSHLGYPYGSDDPLNNPFGRWHMEPAS